MGKRELFFSEGQVHYNPSVLRSALLHACVPIHNALLTQLYQIPGNITRAMLESELLRIWPFPPIVLGHRNSSKNMLHTELAARTLHGNNSENARYNDCNCAVAVLWTSKYHTVI